MNECYCSWCPHHEKDEPFCGVDVCLATKEQLSRYAIERQKLLDKWEKQATQSGSIPRPSR